MRFPARFALPLCVFCAALAAGAWFSRERRAAGPAAAANIPGALPSPLSRPGEALALEADMLSTLMGALAETEPLLRAHRLHDLLNGLDPLQLAALFQRALRVEDFERRGLLLGTLLKRWAALDPAGAGAAARPFCDRLRARTGLDKRSLDFQVNRAWVQALPERALAEALAVPGAAWARSSAWTALQSLAGGNLAQRVDLLARLPASPLRAELCAEALKDLADTDSAAAEARLDLVPNPIERITLQSEILKRLTQHDAAAGLARLLELAPDLPPGLGATRILSVVLGEAAKDNPLAALAVIDQLPQELQARAFGSALGRWAVDHPLEALRWAAGHGIDPADMNAFDSGQGKFASWSPLLATAFQQDHAGTLAWILTQPASAQRDRLLLPGLGSGRDENPMGVYSAFTPEGQAAAAGWLVRSFDVPARIEGWVKDLASGAARAAAIRNLAALQTERAPAIAGSLVDQWSAGPDRNAAILGIASMLARNAPAQALDFARQIAEPGPREATFTDIAHAWLRKDEGAARTWLAGTGELSGNTKRVILRQFAER